MLLEVCHHTSALIDRSHIMIFMPNIANFSRQVISHATPQSQRDRISDVNSRLKLRTASSGLMCAQFPRLDIWSCREDVSRYIDVYDPGLTRISASCAPPAISALCRHSRLKYDTAAPRFFMPEL